MFPRQGICFIIVLIYNINNSFDYLCVMCMQWYKIEKMTIQRTRKLIIFIEVVKRFVFAVSRVQ